MKIRYTGDRPTEAGGVLVKPGGLMPGDFPEEHVANLLAAGEPYAPVLPDQASKDALATAVAAVSAPPAEAAPAHEDKE